MLHIAAEQSGSEEEDFEFFYYFYGLNLGPPGMGPSYTQGPSFEQTW